MVIASGTVRHGTIEIGQAQLPEGARVTVLALEGDETFELGPADEAKLLLAVSEADAGAVIPAADVLAKLR